MTTSTETEVESKPLELTEREIAIAEGRNPDEAKEVAAETPAVENVGTGEVNEQAAAEITEESANAAGDGEAGKEAQDNAGGKEAATPSWLTDEHREYAASYGLADDELSSFGSEGELRRATALIDKRFAALANREAQQATQAQTPAGEQAQAKPAEKQGQTQTQTQALTDDELDPEKFRAAGYDENTVKLVKTVRERLAAKDTELSGLKSQVEMIHRSAAEQAERRMTEQLNTLTDAMDEGRYGRQFDKDGKPQQLSAKAAQDRQKLWGAANVIASGIMQQAQAMGVQPSLPPLNVLLRRAEYLAFGDEIRASEAGRARAAIAKQSATRRPVGKTTGVSAAPKRADSENDQVKSIANHPEIVAAWKRMESEAGV